MRDYLNSLVTRTLRLAPVVQPRPASLFESTAVGPANEAAFAVSENVTTPENAPPPAHAEQQPFDVPARTQEPVLKNSPVHEARSPILLPTQVTPATTFLEGDWERKRERRDQEFPSRSGETESIELVGETRRQSAPATLIKPEVRIVSSPTDREDVQPSVATPPRAPVFSSASRPDSSRTRNLNAQTADRGEAPETVVVTIGRVDVRAIFPAPQAAPRPPRTQPQPLSLDEYLKQRTEGRR